MVVEEVEEEEEEVEGATGTAVPIAEKKRSLPDLA
jgi:hypothetical protein